MARIDFWIQGVDAPLFVRSIRVREAMATARVVYAVNGGTHRFLRRAWAFLLPLVFSGSARAEPGVEFSGGAGFGVLAAGITSGRFVISPSASLSLRGKRGFFVARDTVSFLGASGGRFGINNETTVGGGLSWERVNVSAGVSLAAYSLPLCGPRLCGQVQGLAPGASARLDVFGPYLSGGLGVSVDCAAAWITGSAYPVWSGVSVRCSAGPIFRFGS